MLAIGGLTCHIRLLDEFLGGRPKRKDDVRAVDWGASDRTGTARPANRHFLRDPDMDRAARRRCRAPGRGGGLTDRLLDLRCCDRRAGVGIDEGHASTNRATAVKPRDTDGLAHRGKFLADVPVEGIGGFRRVYRDEGDTVRPRLFHATTMAGPG